MNSWRGEDGVAHLPMWLPMDDEGRAERGPRSQGLSPRAGQTAHSMAQTSLTPSQPAPTFQPQSCNCTGSCLQTLPSLCEFWATGAAAHAAPTLPWSSAQGHKVCKKDRRENIYFLFTAGRAVPVVRIPSALQPPHRSNNVSWAWGKVKKNSLENDKH